MSIIFQVQAVYVICELKGDLSILYSFLLLTSSNSNLSTYSSVVFVMQQAFFHFDSSFEATTTFTMNRGGNLVGVYDFVMVPAQSLGHTQIVCQPLSIIPLSSAPSRYLERYGQCFRKRR